MVVWSCWGRLPFQGHSMAEHPEGMLFWHHISDLIYILGKVLMPITLVSLSDIEKIDF